MASSSFGKAPGSPSSGLGDSDVVAVAEAPAMAMGSLYQAMAQATGLLMQNAMNQQQQLSILAQAATTQGIMEIYSVDAASDVNAFSAFVTPKGAK